jgi:hypothetical protein
VVIPPLSRNDHRNKVAVAVHPGWDARHLISYPVVVFSGASKTTTGYPLTSLRRDEIKTGCPPSCSSLFGEQFQLHISSFLNAKIALRRRVSNGADSIVPPEDGVPRPAQVGRPVRFSPTFLPSFAIVG